MILTNYNTSNISKFLDEIDRFSIGLDPWFKNLNSAYASYSNYPPYDVIDIGDGRKRLEIAIAGFSKKDISVYTEQNLLTVEATKRENENEKYSYSGIAKRSFRRSWTLGDDVRVNSVSLRDGLLVIELSTVIPEHQKRKNYEIV